MTDSLSENLVGYPLDARPFINWHHVDGPLLVLRDGRLHWLTLRERILHSFGLTNADMLEHKHWRTCR